MNIVTFFVCSDKDKRPGSGQSSGQASGQASGGASSQASGQASGQRAEAESGHSGTLSKEGGAVPKVRKVKVEGRDKTVGAVFWCSFFPWVSSLTRLRFDTTKFMLVLSRS